MYTQVAWCEFKRPKGKASEGQLAWIAAERARGALVWLFGVDFEASYEGFLAHYHKSGLQRRQLKTGGAR